MIACERGHLESVKLLIEYGAGPNIKTSNGETALTKASWNGVYDLVEYLLELPGINLFHRDRDGFSAHDYANNRRHLEVMDLLSSKMKAAGSNTR